MKKLILSLAFLVAITASASAERLKVNIDEGNFEPIPLALHGFTSTAANGQKVSAEMLAIIENDLEGTGLFKIIDSNAFPERLTAGQTKPTFDSWSQIGAQGLMTGEIKRADSTIAVDFRLWDVLSGQQIAGTAYSTGEKGMRRISHQIADQIYERLTGEKGYFDTRIVYVAESGAKNRRVKRLAVMDQDGANHQYITNGKTLVLTPRFSPSDQKIIYLSYAQGKPRVRQLAIETGSEAVVGDFPGMTFSPRYNKDGTKLLMAVANNGNTEINELDMRSRTKRKLTDNPAIDTSPFYSPDGSKIVFTSDRGGTEQIYIMNSDGSNVQRISYGSGRYSTPMWSPRGDYIAFTKQSGGSFHIGVMKPDGSGERVLTASYLDEGPSWAPNGRVIVFARGERSGKTSIYSVDITGYNERRIPTPGDASDPTWSPILD